MAKREAFAGRYRQARVLVTGHTGFKGSWLALWLERLGARVSGYALEPPTEPAHWPLLGLGLESVIADVRDAAALAGAIGRLKPEIVFHLAAQPLVLRSYADPVETWQTNVLGTLNLLEACRRANSVRAIVCVTTDKVYRATPGDDRPRREGDELGGGDPYSASKAAMEILVDSYRDSFFAAGPGTAPLLATARGGNVIGGGDWSADRLIPDIVRAAAKNEAVRLRHPEAVRPWQHVLDCLAGYLALGERLLAGEREFAGPWNFGPAPERVTVGRVVELIRGQWPAARAETAPGEHPPETGVLRLDCAKARRLLGWRPRWDQATAVARTIAWYRRHLESGAVLSADDLDAWLDSDEV